MLQSVLEILVFGGKAFILVLAFVAVALTIAFLAARAKDKKQLHVELLDEKYKNYETSFKQILFSKKEWKNELKKLKKESKQDSPDEDQLQRIFVLQFKGDIEAKATEQLREEISALLTLARPEKDEVILQLESPGGVVHGYGLAAAQLLRLREKNIRLTVCVDQVAASGGYMMACVAHQILSAPFAIVGSIGVVAQLPNFHRLLKKHEVDYKEYTAGDFKRTVGVLSEITPQKEEKFKEQLELTHKLFKEFVQQFRPHMDITKVATGEYWFGKTALELGLVDRLVTSDEYIQQKIFSNSTNTVQVVEVRLEKKKAMKEKLSELISQSLEKAILQILFRFKNSFWF